MMKAWYRDDSDADERQPHKTEPPEYLDMRQVREKTGIEYTKIDHAEDLMNCEMLQKLRKERGYSYEDTVEMSTDGLPDFEDKMKMFFTEHLHAYEEIRLVLAGSGYFDVRDQTDCWIRISLEQGDMIVLPAGIYHRFTLDTKNYFKVNRYFIGNPVWKGYDRSDHTDTMPCRVDYTKNLMPH